MKINTRIEKLNPGLKRLLFVISLIFPTYVASIMDNSDNVFYLFELMFEKGEFITAIFAYILLFFLFWILVRIILWIVDGFKI